MKNIICCFASTRYWNDKDELEKAYECVKNELKDLCDTVFLIRELSEVASLSEYGDYSMIALPMSGGVQPNIIEAAKHFANVIVFAGYVKGNFKSQLTEKMIICNAAPAVMDVYAVLRKERNARLCTNHVELKKLLKAQDACEKIRKSKILAIGNTEPWVISAVRDWSIVKQRFGIDVIDVRQEELIEIYDAIDSESANVYYKSWSENASKVIEPTQADILSASKFQTALIKLLEKYNANGAAIACFNMLKSGTTACLGVSYINTYTDYVVSCEGDMDSAITMLIMKALAKDSPWMANPNIQADNTVNFVHCTAPTRINGKNCKYILRDHHESGIGVSTQVEMPKNTKMTACRISDNLSKMMVQNCVGINGEYEPSCRTQLKVKLDDFGKYIRDSLGCHMIFVFNDIKQELTYVAEEFGIELL